MHFSREVTKEKPHFDLSDWSNTPIFKSFVKGEDEFQTIMEVVPDHQLEEFITLFNKSNEIQSTDLVIVDDLLRLGLHPHEVDYHLTFLKKAKSI